MCASQNRDPRVAETAVVGYPHDVFGQGVCVCHEVIYTALSFPLSLSGSHSGIRYSQRWS